MLFFAKLFRRAAAAASLFLCAVLAPPAYPQQPPEPQTPVGVDAVQRQPMTQTVPVIGRLVAVQSGVVAARTAGPVAELAVEVGDRVQQGEVLAVLDQARLQAQADMQAAELKELEASRATAGAREKLARQELQRLERLRGSAAFTQSLYDSRVQELDVARGTLREVEARIARGRVALELAQIELRDATIRAPYPGVVTLRHSSEGAWLRVGDPVVTLMNDQSLEIEADVPAERLSGLRRGSEIEVILDDGRPRQALVRAVIPDENPAARTRAVRLAPEFDATAMDLAANQPVTLRVPAGGQSEVVSVHKDAVLRQGGEAMVFVVEDGVAQPRPVRLGEAVGSRFQVLEGLMPGDLVVIRGNERLRPGQAVNYPEPAPTHNGSERG